MPRSAFAEDGDSALPARKKTAAKNAAKKKASKKKSPRKTTRKVGKKTKPIRKTATKKTAKRKAAGKKKLAKKTTAKKKARKKAAAKTGTRRNQLMTGPLHGFQPYKAKRGEQYMNAGQLGHFRNILKAWRQALMEEVDRTVDHMKDEAANFPDPNDRATQESEFGLELRTRDRERKLIRKISQALTRIEEGSYGYCDETGDEIGLKRLEARPVATLCLDAQERREMAERQYRDRDDRYR
ncbi:MAG: RNA polymerase-binding protein DksA [Proteobacteria bacterium]|nr:RNA polymerase-binding protein DksA [Pseudomonadota bacterium]MCH9026737.1 RNA polymerase-binding protein DksA [Pseudomonadota bacterium]